MSDDRKPGFLVGRTEDGHFVAASVANPFFCFYGDSDDEVVSKASRAVQFFYSSEGQSFDAPVSRTKQVISFVPQRHVEVELEAA